MKLQKAIIPAVLALFFAGCEHGESSTNIPAVRPFSLQRYLGTWYEAARMPHYFEKDMEYVSALNCNIRSCGMINGVVFIFLNRSA